MVIDETVAVVGTFNLDPRSANLNTAYVTIIRDASVGHQLFVVMQEDMKPENAWHTTKEYNPDKEAGWQKRAKAWTKRLIPTSIL